MENTDIQIIETSETDLENIASLWNDGDVMKYVGFPNGLGVTVEYLRNKWLPYVNINDSRRHYSIYHKEIGYCGESYYSVKEDGITALDIKLFSKARGKGIAYIAFKYAIDQAFRKGNASIVHVDPDKRNVKALTLYKKLGFIERPHPDDEVGKTHFYLELSRNNWKK